MRYLRITAVPIPRDTNPVTAPAAELAARLHVGQGPVELRFHRQGGKTLCYLGLDSDLHRKQAKAVLRDHGYLYAEEAPTAAPLTRQLLCRNVNQRAVVCAGSSPQRMLLPATVTSRSTQHAGILQALSHAADGCGAAFLFRRTDSLPLNTASHLHRATPAEGSLCHTLLTNTELFEAVGCVYGNAEDLPILVSEAIYAYPGLTNLTIPASPIDSKLFTQLAADNTVPPMLQPLRYTYIKEELDILAKLTSSHPSLFPLNKDTLFGIAPPVEIGTDSSIRLGFSAAGEPMEIPLARLRQHLFIGGPPGSGKGNQLFAFANQLHAEKIPMLLIESAKEEMHHLRKVIPDLQIWQPKEKEFVLNPFALEGDITCGEMRSSLLQTLRICFKLDGPLEELFSDTLNRCFTKNGFTDDSTLNSPGTTPFGLSEFMEEYTQLLNEKRYSERTRNDMRTAGLVRLNSLFNQNRSVFDTIRSIPVPTLLQGENLIQLNCLTTPEAKQMFISILFISICAWLRLRGKHCADRPVKLAILLDESHNLLQPATDSQGRVYSFARDFQNMLLELRSQGIAIILADQSSNNIPQEIVDTCATKVFFGASTASGITTSLPLVNTDETALKHLYLLEPGEGCFITYGMPTPAYFYCPNMIDLFHLEQSYPRQNQYLTQKHPRFTLEAFRECGKCPARGSCTHADKIAARQSASVLCQNYASQLGKLTENSQQDNHRQISTLMTRILTDIYLKHTGPARYCTLVQFMRDFNRENPASLGLEAMLSNSQKIWTILDQKKP